MRTALQFVRRTAARLGGQSAGYVLVGVLFLMAVLGLGMTTVAQDWSFLHRRAMEKELKFQGDRIMRAILEFRQMQAAGLKPAGLQINNYETLEKALTDQPNPVLLELPPDPLTAVYDDQGKLEEDTGVWGLVVQAGSAPNQPGGTQPGGQASLQARGGIQIVGCPPLKERTGGAFPGAGGLNDPSGLGLSGTELPSVFSEPNPTFRDSRRRGNLPSLRGGSGVTGNVIGVVTCYDDPERPPITLSPSGEEANTYRDWLFVPRDVASGGIGSTGGTTQPGGAAASAGATASVGNYAMNWPESMPAPPIVPGAGVQQGGAGRPPGGGNLQRGLPGGRRGTTNAPRGQRRGSSTFPRR